MTSAAKKATGLGLAVLILGLVLANFLLFPETPDRGPRQARGAGASDAASPAADAAEAVRQCGGKAVLEKNGCYEPLLLELMRSAGVRHAMDTLREIGAADRDVERDGHVYAHAIGIAAYHARPDVARTFAACTEIYQSGCYHGVIQAYFGGVQQVDAAAVNGLCSAYKAPDADRWLLFQCVHGMGHGLTMSYAHDLPRALESCDLLTDEWDRRSCYGGAFMENIVNATVPHHPATAIAHQAHGEGTAGAATAGGHGAGHAPEAAGTRPAFKPLDPDDPLYPCSILADKYQPDCYQMQTSAILFHNGGDMEATARACDGAPLAMRPWCYQGLGRDISSYTYQDHAAGIRLCSLGDPRWQPWCFGGLVKNFVDLTARIDDGFAFCRNVPGVANKMRCTYAVGEQVGTLENGEAGREALCARSEPEYLEACRYGARVTAEKPARLLSETEVGALRS